MWGLDSDIPKGCLGPKAEYVWKLHDAGFKVPESVFIPVYVGIDDNLAVAVLIEVFQRLIELLVRVRVACASVD